MSILNVGQRLLNAQRAQEESENRKKEASQHGLVGTGGFLSVVKYVGFGMLAVLNVRLFTSILPDAWGWVVGGIATLCEAFGVYCWNNQNRSAGRHRTALFVFAIVFTAISILHATASFYDLAGLTNLLGRPLYLYSHFVAFPLMFLTMIVAVCVLYRTHWTAKVAKEQAVAQASIAEGRSSLLTRTAELEGRAELARAELEHYRSQLDIEREQVGILESVLQIEARKQQLLDEVENPDVKERMLRLLGVDASPALPASTARRTAGYVAASADSDPKNPRR